MSKTVIKIVLTGGPCAGKTTGMSWIINNFTKRGYKIFVVSETATELINGGAYPWEAVNSVDFQVALYKMLKEKELTYERMANNVNADKVLIVCDRGAMDGTAYLKENQVDNFYKALNETRTSLMSDYDAVFHLVSSAKGAQEFYTTDNNGARTETAEEAAVMDDKTIAAWTGHPHLRIIDNSTDFEEKMQRLVKEISAFLGEPEPFEIERKFLVEMPDISRIENMPNCRKVEILQTYLKSNNDMEMRVRQRGEEDSFIYTLTKKKKISELKRVETEKRLSVEEYCKLLMTMDPNYKPIRKTRYCIVSNGTYFELDIYPFWNDKAILEVELADEKDTFIIPEFIQVIKDVTDDNNYKNHSLAKI